MTDLERAQALELAQLCPCAESVFYPDYPRIAEALAAARREARDQALEEAAKACVGSGAIVAEARLCSAAIRMLKEKE